MKQTTDSACRMKIYRMYEMRSVASKGKTAASGSTTATAGAAKPMQPAMTD